MKAIYKILNKKSGKFYIGRTVNFKQRMYSHLSCLKKNKHGNFPLQAAWNKYFPEDFEFIILKEVFNNEDLFIEEQKILDELGKDHNSWRNCYNTSRSAKDGGNLTSKEILEKRAELQKTKFLGEGNPNWKGGKSISYCKSCNKKIRSTFNFCRKCYFKQRDVTGSKNPFYGKVHSKESRKKISESNKGKKVPSLQKPFYIDGILYNTLAEADKILGINFTTIRHRIVSKNPMFDNYKYK